MYYHPDRGIPDDEPGCETPDGDDYRATVTEHGDGTRTCLITPETDPPRAAATEWVAAGEGSFVPLDERE